MKDQKFEYYAIYLNNAISNRKIQVLKEILKRSNIFYLILDNQDVIGDILGKSFVDSSEEEKEIKKLLVRSKVLGIEWKNYSELLQNNEGWITFILKHSKYPKRSSIIEAFENNLKKMLKDFFEQLNKKKTKKTQ